MKRHLISKALLALLFMGSASLWAQTSDPFGDVDINKYANTMNITGYVRMVTLVNGQWSAVNDEVLGKEAVVAVYCGNELRGKDSPRDYLDGEYKNLLMLTVHGDTKGQPLHFKVYTKGRVIEVDQGVTFTIDARIGQVAEPFYINLPSPVTTTFSTEEWATTCLPFDAEVPNGVTLYTATDITPSLGTGMPGELVMEKIEATVLPANTPVLLQGNDITSCEWLARIIDSETLTQQSSLLQGGNGGGTSILKGTIEPTDITHNDVLTLGHSNETGAIGFWLYTGSVIPANRAYIADFPSGTNGARIAPTQGISTAVQYVATESQQTEQVYDLQGRRVEEFGIRNSELKKGVYIVNGKKRIY